MPTITNITAVEILDAKGNPTIETTVLLSDGALGIGSTPSGTSVGSHEAIDLRDNDLNRYRGKGVLKAVENINGVIATKLEGMQTTDPRILDQALVALDGTPDKSRLGANALLSVSVAIYKAAAASNHLPLFSYIRRLQLDESPITMPIPTFNVINGGKHASNKLDFQEFMVIPYQSQSFAESLEKGVAIYKALFDVLTKNNLPTLVGDEGGFGPTTLTNTEALTLLLEAVKDADFTIGENILLGIDAASNSFFENNTYVLKEKQVPLSADELIAYYQLLHSTFHFLYLEDGLSEDDWDGWTKLNSQLGDSLMVIGDDLTVTDRSRLAMAIDRNAINGIIVKPNQIGTLHEAMELVLMAKKAKIKTIVSHRSGETNDDFIADFAVGVGSDFVKFGAPARGERIAKYNRLMAIERMILSMK
jgi:enolase